jgi:hypothetical protein
LTFYDEKGLRKKVQFRRSPAGETPSPDRLGPYFIAFWNHGHRFRFTDSKHARARRRPRFFFASPRTELTLSRAPLLIDAKNSLFVYLRFFGEGQFEFSGSRGKASQLGPANYDDLL